MQVIVCRALAVFLWVAATAHADELPPDGGLQGWQFQIENDLFSRVRPDDRWYTNGFRASWTYRTPPATAPTEGLQSLSELLLDGPMTWSPTYSLGQTMYTPQDITRSEPPLGDRPWGAFAYLGFAGHRYDGNWFRVVDIKLGVTGKYAFGEDVQTFVHDKISRSAAPAGWHQQLRPRLGWQLGYAGIQRLATFRDRFAVQWALAGSVGSLRRYVTVGASAMVGDLRGTVTPVFIGNEGDFVVQDFNNRDQFRRVFAYLAVAYTGVAYNYFIEGPTPYGRADIASRHGHRTWQWGLSLPLHAWLGADGRRWLRWPRIVFAQSARTPEFSAAAQVREPTQRWGTLTLHWDLR